MRGASRPRRRAPQFALLAFSAAIASPGFAAQPAGPAEEPRDRVGPEAQPPTLPPFPRPEELTPSVPAPPAPLATTPLPGASRSIGHVRIDVEGDGADAVPPRRWTAPDDPLSGLRLVHESGEPLDADWVRAQFAANLAGGGGTVSTAVALVQLVNRAFLTAGFINSGLVVADQRDLASGILDLRLIYGRLAAAADGTPPVTIQWGEQGARGLDEAFVRSRFPSARQRPLSAVEIERDFRLLAEDPAVRTVTADVRPSDRPGEASLNLIIHPEERFDFYVGAANDRSPAVGGERIYAGGYVRSLLAAGDLLTAEVGTTRGLEDAQVGYSTPVIGPRTMLSLRGSFNNAAVIDRPLLPLDISAEDRSFQAGLSHRFLQRPLTPAGEGRWSPSQTLTGGLLVAYRHQKSFLLGEPFSFAPGSVDGVAEYTALRLTGDYLMRNVDQVLALSLTATMGLGGTQSDVASIPNPDDHFKALLVQANYARRLTESGIELRGRLTGQIADGVLYSGERLSIGGSTSVRGYRENSFLVDNGLIGSIELAVPFSLSSGRRRAAGGTDWGAFSVFAFADAALFENAEPPPPGEDFIASVGIGLSWTPSDAIFASITYGIDLVDVPLAGEGGPGPGGPGPGPGPGPGGRNRDLQDRGIQFRIVIHPLRLFRRGQGG